VLASGTELDWIGFLYGINQLPAGSTWQIGNIFDAYLLACGDGTVAGAAVCSGRQVSWAGDMTHKSLTAGVSGLLAEGLQTQSAADEFVRAGDRFGVSPTVP
jgi:hypothetical protein